MVAADRPGLPVGGAIELLRPLRRCVEQVIT
jgi:hypothetical protein